LLPLRSVTGATPTHFWTAAASAETLAILAEVGEQARGEHRTSARASREEAEVWKGLAAFGDVDVEASDAGRQRAKLWEECGDDSERRLDDGGAAGQRVREHTNEGDSIPALRGMSSFGQGARVVILTLGVSACATPGGVPELTTDGGQADEAGVTDGGGDRPDASSGVDMTENCGLTVTPAAPVPGVECVFLIPEPTVHYQSRSQIDVLLGDKRLPMSLEDGWDYGDSALRTIQLIGASCERYLADPSAVVKVAFRCTLA
jgi:hypothetical protein